MTFDANEHRDASLRGWEEAAPGWVARQALMRQFAAPVSHWMIEAISPQPGETVLELAAGLGETGLLAAELVAPNGEVIISDQAQGMLDGARERAEELGIKNVRFEEYGAEWIDRPVASTDAVLCRFGYMLMADPLAALGETRRVLRPGGRIALAVWDQIESNPWAHASALELAERGLIDAQEGFRPGPFALDDQKRLRELLQEAGFTDPRLDFLDLSQRHASFADFWETMLDLSRSLHDAVLTRPEQEALQIRDAIRKRLGAFTATDGTLEIPGRALLATASA